MAKCFRLIKDGTYLGNPKEPPLAQANQCDDVWAWDGAVVNLQTSLIEERFEQKLVDLENFLEILIWGPPMETAQELVRREFGSNLPSFLLQKNRPRFSYHTKWTDLAVTG